MSKSGINRNLPNDAYEAATNANNPSALNPFITEIDSAINTASLILYPTTAASGIPTYNLLVNSITDPNYDDPAVDLSTGAITGPAQLIASLASAPGVISGNPGTVNVNTIGNIRRVSGTGTATFYFEIYHRDNLGTETLIGTSNTTYDATSGVYEQFFASALVTGIVFNPTDRIVTKWYANRIAGGSNPTYEIQIGGATPVKITFPVPLVSLPTGEVDGSGTLNYLAKWTPDGTTLGDSVIQDDGTTLGINASPLSFFQVYLQSDPNASTGIVVNNQANTNNIDLYGAQFNVGTGSSQAKITGIRAGVASTTSATGRKVGMELVSNSLITPNYPAGGVFSSIGQIISFGPNANNNNGVLGLYVASKTSNTTDNYGVIIDVTNPGVGSQYGLQVIDGTQGAGKVLTSDALGRATWQTPAGGPGSMKYSRNIWMYNVVGAVGYTWNGVSIAAPTAAITSTTHPHRLFNCSGTNNQHQGVYFEQQLPSYYTAGANIRVVLNVTALTATGGAVFYCGLTQPTAANVLGGTTETEWIAQTATFTGVTGYHVVPLTYTFTGTNMTPGDSLLFRIYRDPNDAGDTLGTVGMVSLAIEEL